MGYKKPTMRGLAHHLSTPTTISQMRRDHWVVMARCTTCQLDLRLDLGILIRLNGPDLTLFGRDCRCRRMACPGRMIFMATPPGEPAGMFWVLRAVPKPSHGTTSSPGRLRGL